MMRILIVEDSPYKLGKIRAVLTDNLMISAESIDEAADIKSAKRLLVDTLYDLLILDLVLPLERGDEPMPEKGIGLLKDLESSPTLIPPIHIIGLTEFGELRERFEDDFTHYLWHLINYDATEFNWQDKLKNIVYHLINTKQRFLNSTNRENERNTDIFVLCALQAPEFDKILDWPVLWEKFNLTDDPNQYYRCSITRLQKTIRISAVCIGEMGMTATAVVVTKVIHHMNPRFIIMGGICAGLQERGLSYGDIIIADQSWDYGSGKMRDQTSADAGIGQTIFEPDPRPISISALLKSKVNSFLRKQELLSTIQQQWRYNKPNTVLKVMIGPMASGSYVISSLSKLAEIKQTQRKLLGVEMEGYGLYYACEHNRDKSVKAMIVKSVSDFGDSTKNDQFQDYSAFTSAQFIYHFICEELMK